VLYLRGISTGDFQEALPAILGADAPNLSPGVITHLFLCAKPVPTLAQHAPKSRMF